MDAKIVKFSVITRIVVPDGLDEDNIAMFAMDKIAENPFDYLSCKHAIRALFQHSTENILFKNEK